MNKIYHNALLGVDLSNDADPYHTEDITYQALRICRQLETPLNVVYVAQPVPAGYNGQMVMDLGIVYHHIEEEAQDRLQQFANHFGIPCQRQSVRLGQAHVILPRFIRETDVDLVIIGKKPRFGLKSWFAPKVASALDQVGTDVLSLRS